MADTTLVHGVDFQRAVLRLMMLDAGFCGKSVDFLKEGYFTGELSWFFRKVKSYYTDFRRPMSSAELQTEIFKHGDPAEIRKYEAERQAIVATDVSTDKFLNPDYIKRELTGFVRANVFVGSYQEAAQLYNSGNKQSAFEFTKDRLDQLLNVDFEREQTVDCGDYKTVLAEASSQRGKAIPTGIHAIDQAMGGGLLPQTWTTFLGGSNAGKCLSEDSPVPTDRGLIKISEALPGDRVFGIDGTRRVLAVHKNGKKPVKKMTLKNGLSLESTQDHVHVVMNDEGKVEKKLSDIRVGDWVVVPSGGWSGKKEIDPDLAWLLGFTFGDGSYFKVRGSRQLSWFVSFEPFQKKIIRILKKHGCQNPRIYPRGSGVAIHSNMKIADLLEGYGLRVGTGLKKSFINTWGWSEESVGWFIAGIMDADGTLNFSGTHLSLVLRHEAVFEIQQILLRLGIFSSSRTRFKTIRLPKKTINNYKVFSLTVSGENVDRFLKKIPISNKWKDRRFFLRPKKGGQDHVFVTPEIRNEVRQNKVLEGGKQKGKRIRNSVCSRSHLQKMGIKFEQDFFISQVTSVRSVGVKETYDLSVDRDNLFVAGGILTHNSMLCPNLAYAAVMAGKKVFITVHEDEINPTLIRYFSRFTGIPMDRLTLPESMRTPAEEAALAGVSALIKDKIKLRFMYGNESFIERLQDVVYQQHDQWPFDLFLCDYGQCLKSRAFKNMDNTYSVQEFIYSELKQLCLALNIAGAGGAQVNRQGHKVGRAGSDFLRMTDVGDSWGIAKKSSNVITMNRSAEDMVNNRITFLLDKVRHGRCPVAVQCVTDYSKAMVYNPDPVLQVEISVADGPAANTARDE